MKELSYKEKRRETQRYLHNHPEVVVEMSKKVGNVVYVPGTPRAKALWRQVDDMTPEERLKVLPINPISERGCVLHTRYYIRLRDSFVRSKEWKEFRASFLASHPVCESCGKPSNVVHHRDDYTIDSTIIAEGLLEPLKHPERFEALCQDCHFGGHEEMIEGERRVEGLLKCFSNDEATEAMVNTANDISRIANVGSKRS